MSNIYNYIDYTKLIDIAYNNKVDVNEMINIMIDLEQVAKNKKALLDGKIIEIFYIAEHNGTMQADTIVNKSILLEAFEGLEYTLQCKMEVERVKIERNLNLIRSKNGQRSQTANCN